MALLLKLALDHPVQISAGICDEVIPFGQRVEFLMLDVQIPQLLVPGAPQQQIVAVVIFFKLFSKKATGNTDC